MTKTEILANYEAASLASDAAFATFDPIRSGYRAGTVSVDAYFAARKIYEATKDAFDVAYSLVADLPEETEVEAFSGQLELL